ncbi:hypothetical protein E2C01_083556 [Portunus trituberculatus]|uniref:Uncharacterized protein n=1 Tax=Portunus trituberculatus TaxID=210409 RepID=A0A5B7IVI2_PORTR|nr:hypothetical protein [Portunus trituberculatus]
MCYVHYLLGTSKPQPPLAHPPLTPNFSMDHTSQGWQGGHGWGQGQASLVASGRPPGAGLDSAGTSGAGEAPWLAPPPPGPASCGLPRGKQPPLSPPVPDQGPRQGIRPPFPSP